VSVPVQLSNEGLLPTEEDFAFGDMTLRHAKRSSIFCRSMALPPNEWPAAKNHDRLWRAFADYQVNEGTDLNDGSSRF